jgi:DNA-binding CsgD family transcriptional regulator
VPPQRTVLIGREHDIARIRPLTLHTEGRLVTLTGAGGCGKTRLALAVAAELADSFRDGVYWVELASLTDPTLVPGIVATALNVKERAGQPLIDSLVARLRQFQALLVLDNCEHLVDACAELVDRILRACPGAEAERLLAQALERFAALSDGGVLRAVEEIWALYSLGVSASEQGDAVRAAEIQTHCLQRAKAVGGLSGAGFKQESWPLTGLARAAHQLGDYARAQSLYREAITKARHFDVPFLLTPALNGLGQVLLDLGDFSSARAAFEECLALAEDLSEPVALARALIGFAGLAVVEGQQRRGLLLVGAAEQLREAYLSPLSPAERSDLDRRLELPRRLLGDEAVELLIKDGRALGIEKAVELARASAVPRVRAATQGVLTTREQEIAVLVGRGLSNREIGERLSITRRTVAAHVEHLLSKLGYTSRTEVGVWAAEHGLLSGKTLVN